MKRQILSGCGVAVIAGLMAGYLTADTRADKRGSGTPAKKTIARKTSTATAPPADGGVAGGCSTSTGADVIVGSMNGTQRWAGDGTKTAYSFGTTSCNIGDVPLQWIDEGTSVLYPVIAQNMFRLSSDGRFEQIGMGWLKHAFCALQDTLCSGSCQAYCGGCCDHLGPCCSDPYSASLNGGQTGLGPRYEVNAHTGAHPNIDVAGYAPPGPIADAFSRRVIVQNTDLNATKNPGAKYFIEGQYVTIDDATNAHQNNNASYRKVFVGAAPSHNLSFDGGTLQQQQAIRAWQTHDPFASDGNPDNNVVLTEIGPGVTNEGLLILGCQVRELPGAAGSPGATTWHYEYAIYNMTSDRSVRRFTVPIGENVTVSNIGFHDINYHSGEPWDGTDWAGVQSGDGLTLTWQTSTYAADPEANAIRWGTMYNFRFDADSPPASADVAFEFFKPGKGGDPNVIEVASKGPGPVKSACPWDSDSDGEVSVTDLVALIMAWGDCPGCASDFNGDDMVDVLDLVALVTNWGDCP